MAKIGGGPGLISSSATISVRIRAPTGPFKTNVKTVTDVAANPLPAALTDRVSLSIQNESAVETVFFGDATVTADNAATGGWPIGPGETFNIDLDSSNTFFLRMAAGKTATVRIIEVAST